jgi:hypothetical protein
LLKPPAGSHSRPQAIAGTWPPASRTTGPRPRRSRSPSGADTPFPRNSGQGSGPRDSRRVTKPGPTRPRASRRAQRSRRSRQGSCTEEAQSGGGAAAGPFRRWLGSGVVTPACHLVARSTGSECRSVLVSQVSGALLAGRLPAASRRMMLMRPSATSPVDTIRSLFSAAGISGFGGG